MLTDLGCAFMEVSLGSIRAPSLLSVSIDFGVELALVRLAGSGIGRRDGQPYDRPHIDAILDHVSSPTEKFLFSEPNSLSKIGISSGGGPAISPANAGNRRSWGNTCNRRSSSGT